MLAKMLYPSPWLLMLPKNALRTPIRYKKALPTPLLYMHAEGQQKCWQPVPFFNFPYELGGVYLRVCPHFREC